MAARSDDEAGYGRYIHSSDFTTINQASPTTNLSSGRLENQNVVEPFLLGSSHQQREHVTTALDRMGAGVIEVREAFQQWVQRKRRAPTTHGAGRADAGPKVTGPQSGRGHQIADAATLLTGDGTRAGSTFTSVPVAFQNVTGTDHLEGAMIRAMAELRLPTETAEAFCKGAGRATETEARADDVSFSAFVERYADAVGLLRDFAPHRNGGEVWADGPGGMWVAVSGKELADARAVFDDKVAEQEGKTKSTDKGKTRHLQ